MKLGGDMLTELFHGGSWRAYKGDVLMPFEEVKKLIGPNSIDVTLSNTFLFPQIIPEEVDPRNPASIQWIKTCISDSITLESGGFCLGAVNERFVCDAPVTMDTGLYFFAPMYEGRSSCGRIGLASHITAGFGDYGFAGAFTLELYNHFPRPIKLYQGMRIGQVAFEEVHMPKRYQGAYSGTNHNQGPVEPKLGPDRF